MIYSDSDIYEWAVIREGVRNFNAENVNPASIDLRWSGNYKVAGKPGIVRGAILKVVKAISRNAYEDIVEDFDSNWSFEQSAERLVLEPGKFYLMDTMEYITMPSDCVGKLFLKSSAGRMGIEHLHAGYIDPDFSGTVTLELESRVPWPIVIYKGQRIVQLTIETMLNTPNVSYADVGRYNGQRGPTESRGLQRV